MGRPCCSKRREPAHELVGDGAMAAREQHQHRPRIRDQNAGEQRIVVG
jgi:hypothetical protein